MELMNLPRVNGKVKGVGTRFQLQDLKFTLKKVGHALKPLEKPAIKIGEKAAIAAIVANNLQNMYEESPGINYLQNMYEESPGINYLQELPILSGVPTPSYLSYMPVVDTGMMTVPY